MLIHYYCQAANHALALPPDEFSKPGERLAADAAGASANGEA